MFTYLYSAVRDPILHALFTGNMYQHVNTQQALFTFPRSGLPTTEGEVDVAAAEVAQGLSLRRCRVRVPQPTFVVHVQVPYYQNP